MRVLPYRTTEQSIDGALITFTDITRIVKAEAREQELRWCIDAMLPTVVDLAGRNLPDGPESLALRNELHALADTCRLASRMDWGNVPLADLIGRELADFGIGRAGRVVMDGTRVLVRANAAISLGMALHELATRAVAEGALSVPQGRVYLEWAIEPADGAERRLVIRWRPGGARAGRAGSRSSVDRDRAARRIGAAGSISFGQDGVRTEIALPLASGLVLPLPSEGE